MLDWLLLVVLVVLPMRAIRILLSLGVSVGVERHGKVRGGRRARHLFDRKDRVHRNRSILSITSIFISIPPLLFFGLRMVFRMRCLGAPDG